MNGRRIAIPVAAAIGFMVAAGCGAVFATGSTADFGDDELDGKAGIVPSAMPVPPLPGTDERTSADAAQGNLLWGMSMDALHATRERPLFSPSRRPPTPAVANATVSPVKTVAPATAAAPALSLLGIVAGKDEALAVFINTTTHDTVRLKTGEGEDGWVLRSVTGREAILEKDHRIEVLQLPPTARVPK